MGKMKAVIATYNISDGKCEMTSCKVFDPAVEPVMIQSTNLKANTKIGVMLLEDFDTVKPIYQTNGGYVGAAGEVLHDYNS